MLSIRLSIQHWALTSLATLFGLQLIRVLFPTFLFYLRDAQSMSPTTLAPIAIGIFLLSILAWPLSRLDVPLALIMTAVLLALARILLQTSQSPQAQLFIGGAGVVLFLMYLPLALSDALARGTPEVAHFGLALLLGVALDTALHSAFLTYDLVWQGSLGNLVIIIFFSALLLVSLGSHLNEAVPPEPMQLPWSKALALAAIGPWLLLQLIVFQNVSRLAAVSGWPLPAAGLMITFGNVLGIGLALMIARSGWQNILPLALMGLLFFAALFFSESTAFPAALLVPIGQIMGSGLLMALLLSMGEGTAVSNIGRLAIANTIGAVLLVVLTFTYYVSYDIPLGFRATAVLPVVGLIFLLILLFTARNGHPPSLPQIDSRALLVAGLFLLMPLSSWVGWQNLRDVEQPPINEPVQLINFNVHNGFNTRGRFDLEAIAREIEESGADIVGLQEVSRGWLINGSADMAQWLSQRLGMPYVFGATEGPMWGNAILSRYPILGVENHPLGPDGLLIRRGYLTAEIDTGQEILTVTVTHFHHPDDASEERQLQAQQLLAGHSRETAVIMGDLNAVPDSLEMALFRQAGFVDVLSGLPSGTNYTNPSQQPYRQIDYILLSPDLAFTGAEVIRTTASDHLPIIVQLGGE